MPAFSVTTLKLIARSIRTIANRTALASSQPTIRIDDREQHARQELADLMQRRPHRLEQHFHVFHRILRVSSAAALGAAVPRPASALSRPAMSSSPRSGMRTQSGRFSTS